MSKRTRLFVVTASTMIAAGVGTAAVASYVGFANLRLQRTTVEDDLRFIPAGAEFLAYADVRGLMDSDLRQKLHPDLTSGRGGHLIDEIGLDIARDVDSVLVAGLPAASTASGADADPSIPTRRERPLLLARGRFDVGRIEARVRDTGGTPDHQHGIRVVTSERIGVAFLDTGFIAVGDPAVVAQALDTQAGRAPGIRTHDDMMRLMGQVDDGTTWMVANLQAVQSSAVSIPLVGQLPAISWLAASGRVTDGVEAKVFAEGRDDRAAADLREVIRGMIALARLQSGGNSEIDTWLNSVQLSNSGRTVSLSFALPAGFFERLQSNPSLLPQVPPARSGRAVPPPNGRRRPARAAA